MQQVEEADYIVEIDLSKVAKEMIYLSGISLALLFSFQFIIYHFISYTFTFLTFSLDFLIFLVAYLILIVLHEFFHLLGFRIFSKVPWKKMNVGFSLKMGIAYATTKEWMKNKDLRKSLLLPFWMTGVLPAIIGLALNHSLLLILSALLIGGAAGDFSMYRQLKKLPDDWLIKDHPTKPILYVYRPEKIIN